MVSIGTVWDRTVDFTRDHLGSVMPVVLATQFLPGVVTGSLQRVQQGASGGLAFGLSLLSVATTLIALWGGLYLTAYAAQDGRHEDAGVARRLARTRFLPLLGMSLLVFGIVLIAMLPGIVLVVLSGIDFMALAAGVQPPVEQLGSLGWAALYFVMAVVALLWLFARLIPLTAVVAMERRGTGAITRAFALTRGMALKLIGLLILYGIVAAIAVSAARFVFGSIFALFSDNTSSVSIGDVVTAIALAAVGAALALFQAVFIGKLYRATVGDQDKAAVFG